MMVNIIPYITDKCGDCFQTYFGNEELMDNKETRYNASTGMVLDEFDDTIYEHFNEYK